MIYRYFIALIYILLPQFVFSDSQFRESLFKDAQELPNLCVTQLLEKAQAAGISSSISNIIPSLKHLPKVIEYDQTQPEFTQTFSSYINRRVNDYRINAGKHLYKKHRQFLKSLTQKYGIPGRYLIAFWGLETNFGSYLGKMPTLDSLATLACDKRRSDFFTNELILALKLLERESLNINDMQGSWAGAMGHTQFMPSTYYRYAIDGDNDGKINLYQNEKDALASGANFLSQLGWKEEVRWGREVLLPNDFPYEKTGLKNRQSLKYWQKLGVTKSNKQKLPDLDIKAAVLVPAGHKGPAFLVYRNFNTILNWNRSNYYAISIGLLADRVASEAGLSKPIIEQNPLSKNKVKRIQKALKSKGFNAGGADGILGTKSKLALQAFQLSVGLPADAYPDKKTISILLK